MAAGVAEGITRHHSAKSLGLMVLEQRGFSIFNLLVLDILSLFQTTQPLKSLMGQCFQPKTRRRYSECT